MEETQYQGRRQNKLESDFEKPNSQCVHGCKHRDTVTSSDSCVPVSQQVPRLEGSRVNSCATCAGRMLSTKRVDAD